MIVWPCVGIAGLLLLATGWLVAAAGRPWFLIDFYHLTRQRSNMVANELERRSAARKASREATPAPAPATPREGVNQ